MPVYLKMLTVDCKLKMLTSTLRENHPIGLHEANAKWLHLERAAINRVTYTYSIYDG